MQEARFVFYALWQALALCEDCYRQRYSVAAKCERRRHREIST